MNSKVLILIGLTQLYFGCASYSKVLINNEGKTQSCMITGGGIFGIVMAESAYNSCISGLKAAGYVEVNKAGSIGVIINNETPPRVLKVKYNSPAEKFGIRKGDRIIEIDGSEVKTKYDAEILMFGFSGEQKDIKYLRDSSVNTIKINLESIATIEDRKPEIHNNTPDINCEEISDKVERYECQRSKRTKAK